MPARFKHAGAATVSPDPAGLFDLPCAVIWPHDLPDGNNLGLHSGLTYRGLSAGLETRTLSQELIAALGPAAERLIGGHTTVLMPLGGQQNEWVRTEFWQFPANQDASQVRDLFGIPGAGITQLPGGSDKGIFLASLSQANGSTVESRYVVFRSGAVVGRITTGWRNGAASAPSPEESGALLEELRKASVRRLQTITDLGFAGLATTIPTIAQLGDASGGAMQFGTNYWNQTYTQMNGDPIRQLFQTDDKFQQFRQNHANAVESFARTETARTFGGNPVLVRVDAYRFDSDDAAQEYDDRIGERTAEEADTEPGFEARPIDPPAGTTSHQSSQWYENRISASSGQSLGVRGWHRNGTDVVGILVAGAPRSPSQNDDPAYQGSLLDFARLGSETYGSWRAFAEAFGASGEEAEEFARACQAYDELVAALDAVDD